MLILDVNLMTSLVNDIFQHPNKPDLAKTLARLLIRALSIMKHMKKSQKVRSGWEHRFPALDGKWSHWKIMGDGALLAYIDGKDLAAAMKVIDDNYGRFDSIKVSRSVVDQEGTLIEEENAWFEISRFIYDERIQ